MKRRSFLASLIGAALAPRLVLALMPRAALAHMPLVWADGGMLSGAGRVIEISLFGELDEPVDFAVCRANGEPLFRSKIAMGGGMIYQPTGGLVTLERPILIRAHQSLDGAVIWQPMGGAPVSIPIRGGRLS